MDRKFTVAEELTYEGVKACGPDAVQKFVELLGKGESVNIAAICATRTPAALGNNDQTFMKNRRSLLDQFDGNQNMLDLYNRNYKAETGEDIPAGAFIFRGLAKYPGDKEAVMTHKHTLSDVQKAMKERNVEIHGDFEQSLRQQAPKPQEVRMRADLVEEHVDLAIGDQPELAEMNRDDLREEIISTRAPVVDISNLNPMGVDNKKALLDKTFKL